MNYTSQTFVDPTTVVIQKIEKPSMYKVIMLNDDFTPMDFVVSVLESIFQKDTEEAIDIMFNIHHQGIGICGVFTYEIAETKIRQTLNLAKEHQHPLQCIIERE